MQDRRLVIAMIVGMVLLILWPQLFLLIGTKLGYDMKPRDIPAPTTQAAASASTMPTTFEAASQPSIGAPGGYHVAAATQPAQTVTIGSSIDNDPTYKLALTLSSQGAGIDQVLLNEYKTEAQSKEPFVFEQPYAGAEAMSRPLATQSIFINGTLVDLSAANWTLDKSDDHSATYSVTIEDSTGPKLRVHKSYQVTKSSDPAAGYEVDVEQSFENLTDQPLSVHTMFSGPTMPPRESDRGGDRYVLNGYLHKNTIQVTHDAIEGFGEKAPSKDFTKDSEGDSIVWTGSCSIYFNALIEPLPMASDKEIAGYIQNVTAGAINPAVASAEHQIVIGVTTAELEVPPRQAISLPMKAFFGPRVRKLLLSDYYAAFPRAFNETLVLTSGPCAVCTFQWLINILVWLLNVFHYILFKDWGLAIIGLVILVRALLHPITKRSQISMSKMSKMGPEMERLKKKYGDDKEGLNKAMVGFYKEQGATPILGCLPMFLQTPIWIALWQALQTTFELRQAPFLQFFGIPFTWIHDLSKPDHLIEFSKTFDFFFLHISGLNLLPILMAVAFFFQTKLQPKPAAATPEQAQQQKMMQWMTLLFPIMLYSGPSGLNLYIMTSTAIGIVESKIVRDHIKQREEEEKAARVIVDPGKKLKSGGGIKIGAGSDKPKSGGIMGWIAELQSKADQLRREAEKRK